jgi:hypothetical protein
MISAVIIGAVTAVVLFAVHYALDHYAPAFHAHPPRAYTVGVLILFGGYAAWGVSNPAPLPPLTTVAALFVLTAVAGLGTWGAYAWHGAQKRIKGQRVAKGLEHGTGPTR